MRAITKRFPGVLALNEVNFDVRRGEVHALVGENGAGKSTLMKILSGVYIRDSGDVIFKGQHVNFTTPRQAQVAGITTIYQELNQVAQMSVTENIFLGSEIERGVLVDWPQMHRQARALLAKLHLDIDPRLPLSSLGVGQQQMVEVAKALHHRSDLIIMDEPTSALSVREIEDLFAIIRELKAQGVSIVYISHHLDEAFEITDRITVLRDGRHITTQPTGALNVDSLIRYMVGRDVSEQFPKEVVPRGPEVLRVENLTQGDRLRNISFTAYAGEVLGIAGLVGAGRTELMRAIFGADPIDSGRFYVDGRPVTIHSPRDAIRHGIGLLTEDRKQQGLVLKMTTRENITMSVLPRLTRGLLTSRRREAALAQRFIDNLAIKTPSQNQLVINLSGGTQQKVVLSKWMATEPRVLIFDEPTRGIDVGAKVEIYKLMNQLARQGVAILMVSSELPEIMGMSDRIMVIREGEVTGFINRADYPDTQALQEKIMEYATGSNKIVPETA
ncbi:MAG: sugar ABC transporter ATP-binding protein [Chloroflexi bacterium]|nr:sugar ABC transporter ATP-binding protein [Chloroflexota bacterium]